MGRCGDIVKVDLEEVECEVLDCIKLILDMNSVINLHAP